MNRSATLQVILALWLPLAGFACMKAERLGTDTNSPEGFTLGIFGFGLGAAGFSTLGGTLTGYTGTGLVLRNNGGDDLAVSAGATSFTFATSLASGTSYSVTVATQPGNAPQTCTISRGTGTVSGGDVAVTDVEVRCEDRPWTAGAVATLGPGITSSPLLRSGIAGNGIGHVLYNDNDSAGVPNGTIKHATGTTSWTATQLAGGPAASFVSLDIAVNEAGQAIATYHQSAGSPFGTRYRFYDPATATWPGSAPLADCVAGSRAGIWSDGDGFVACHGPSAFSFAALVYPVTAGILGTIVTPSDYHSDSGFLADIGTGANRRAVVVSIDPVSSPAHFDVYHSPGTSAWLNLTDPSLSTGYSPVAAAVNGAGKMAVMGTSGGDPNSVNVFLSSDGAAWDPSPASFAVAPSYPGVDVALDEAGNGIAAWNNQVAAAPLLHWSVYRPGAGWSVPVAVPRATSADGGISAPILAVNEVGFGYLAVAEWIAGTTWNVRVMTVDLRSGTVGSPRTLSTTGTESEGVPVVHMSVNATGQAVLAWSDYGTAGCGSATLFCIKAATIQ